MRPVEDRVMLRVIAGSARAIRLEIPRGVEVRPTLDRVREACFSMLMPRIAGARFLDLFAGSGANGIEALSRGADSCVFVDSHSACLKTVQANLERTGFSDRSRLVRADLPVDFGKLAGAGAAFDLIYADPPFQFEEYNELVKSIFDKGLLESGGWLVVEHLRKNPLDSTGVGLTLERTADYGRTRLSIFS